jgi:hypothetical protein
MWGGGFKMRIASRTVLALLALGLPSAATFADTVNIGFISYDLSNAPGPLPGTTVFPTIPALILS